MSPARNLANDLLITAVEGGSNYWGLFLNYQLPGQVDDGSVVVVDHDETECAQFNFLGHILNWDEIRAEVADGTIPSAHITGGHLEQVLRKMAKGEAYDLPDSRKTWAIDALTEPEDTDYDAWDADLVLQLAVFGDVIYG